MMVDFEEPLERQFYKLCMIEINIHQIRLKLGVINHPPPIRSQEGTRNQKGEISRDISKFQNFQAKTAL